VHERDPRALARQRLYGAARARARAGREEKVEALYAARRELFERKEVRAHPDVRVVPPQRLLSRPDLRPSALR
jgi:hypothetical protein